MLCLLYPAFLATRPPIWQSGSGSSLTNIAGWSDQRCLHQYPALLVTRYLKWHLCNGGSPTNIVVSFQHVPGVLPCCSPVHSSVDPVMVAVRLCNSVSPTRASGGRLAEVLALSSPLSAHVAALE